MQNPRSLIKEPKDEAAKRDGSRSRERHAKNSSITGQNSSNFNNHPTSSKNQRASQYASTSPQQVQEAIIDLYLQVKVRSLDEVSSLIPLIVVTD